MAENDTDPDNAAARDFAAQAAQVQTGLVAELWGFLRHNKKWWLTPIIVLLLLIGTLLLLAGTAAGPFIYPLF